ncbi:MAG: tetratricopeptide repeat protein [Fimbriimonadaceae bacterium]|nr:tetratricopeptide repeat protein [Fimbriimonadaceae bacterium]
MGVLDKWFVFGRDPKFDEGIRAYQREDFDEAIVHLTGYISRKPVDFTLTRLAKLYLSECLSKKGDACKSEDAILLFRESTLVQPNFADNHFRLARALTQCGQTQEAIRAANRALEINPQFVAAHLIKAILHYQVEECDVAMNSVIDAIELQPSLDNPTYQAFVELHNAGKNEQAIDLLWTLCGAVSCDLTKEQIQQAVSFATDGRHEDACDLFLRLIESVPRYADVRCRYGECLMELGHLEAAREQFEAALAINPTYADAMAAMGVLQFREGDLDEANKSFKQVLQWNPEHPVAADQLNRLRR